MNRQCELIMVATETVGRLAGFDGRGRHREYPTTLRAWWPSQGADSLRGLRFSRVTVTDGVGRYVYGRRDQRLQRELAEAVDYARYALVYAPRLWIEL